MNAKESSEAKAKKRTPRKTRISKSSPPAATKKIKPDAQFGRELIALRDQITDLIDGHLASIDATSRGSAKINTAPKSPYSPPESASKFIRNISLKISQPFQPGEQLKGLKEIRIIGDGVVLLDSDLSTDADGSPRAREIDKYGQLETAFNFPNQSGQNRYVNAEVIPYVVLPGSQHPDKRPKERYLYNRLGLQLGDLAAVIWNGKLDFAMFADAGPNDHIGEGSIALVESLGWNPWNKERTQIVSGIPHGALTFFFPKSKLSGLTPQNAASKIRKKGRELFEGIGGIIN